MHGTALGADDLETAVCSSSLRLDRSSMLRYQHGEGCEYHRRESAGCPNAGAVKSMR